MTQPDKNLRKTLQLVIHKYELGPAELFDLPKNALEWVVYAMYTKGVPVGFIAHELSISANQVAQILTDVNPSYLHTSPNQGAHMSKNELAFTSNRNIIVSLSVLMLLIILAILGLRRRGTR